MVWLTPLFQSERDFAARGCDRVFHPLSPTPGARGQMLRVLGGARKGWLGRFPLPGDFCDVPADVVRRRQREQPSTPLARA